jgi:DNA processing protein
MNAPNVMEDTCTPTNTPLRWWLALLHTPGLGCRGIQSLIDEIDDPAHLFLEEHPARQRLSPELRSALRRVDWGLVERDIEWQTGDGRHILTLADPAYPPLLGKIPDPPPVLFVHGDPELLSAPQLAIVGSRNPTPSGRQTAHDFARALASAGLGITSGLAIGIDGAAHQGALDADGITLAVTGTGLDRVYPARHRKLAHQIAEQGALVSEFTPGTPPLPANFPRRNRIISGIGLGTLVVEAAVKSGSLVTARLALEQGREVFAIPGSIHNPLARGCHSLIRQGAKLVETMEDILAELGPLLSTPTPEAGTGIPPKQAPAESWDEDYQRLLQHLGYDPVSVDYLIQQSGLTAEAVSSMLLLLELEGYVSSVPGGRYCLSGK